MGNTISIDHATISFEIVTVNSIIAFIGFDIAGSGFPKHQRLVTCATEVNFPTAVLWPPAQLGLIS